MNNLFVNVVLAPDLNTILFSALEFPEVWSWRQVCKTLQNEIPNQLTTLHMNETLLPHVFPKAKILKLEFREADVIRLSKQQFPRLESLTIDCRSLHALQVDPQIQLKEFHALWYCRILHWSVRWDQLKRASLSLTANEFLPILTQLAPKLEHLVVCHCNDKNLYFPNIPIANLELYSTLDTLLLPQAEALETLVVKDTKVIGVQDRAVFPHLQELVADVDQGLEEWTMPVLKTLDVKSISPCRITVPPSITQVTIKGVAVHGTNCPNLESLVVYSNCVLQLPNLPSLKKLKVTHPLKRTDCRVEIPYHNLTDLTLCLSMDSQYLFTPKECMSILSQATQLQTLRILFVLQREDSVEDVKRALQDLFSVAVVRVPQCLFGLHGKYGNILGFQIQDLDLNAMDGDMYEYFAQLWTSSFYTKPSSVFALYDY